MPPAHSSASLLLLSNMEAHEESMMHSDSSISSTGESLCLVAIKRKRTKRHCNLPPPPAATETFSAYSVDLTVATDKEEEDIANCLILLARGHALHGHGHPESERTGLYLYECKTCSKCFPSFQALGGHRASHKKPRVAAPPLWPWFSAEEKKAVINDVKNRRPRNHVCSICGTEFSSGQALGGHMRRHRPAVDYIQVNTDHRKEKSVLQLDLNFPASADEDHLAVSTKPFDLSPAAAALVDCNY